MNPTTDIVEKRVSLLEGAPSLGGCAVASGTAANFYAIINCASMGDNIVSARNLYGGTYTMFADILPTMGITCNFVDSQDPANFAAAINDKTRCIFCEVRFTPHLFLPHAPKTQAALLRSVSLELTAHRASCSPAPTRHWRSATSRPSPRSPPTTVSR